MGALSLSTVTPATVGDACRLAVRPEQERFVFPVAVSLAEAYARPTVAWPRLVFRDGEVVGFVMGGFDPESPVWYFRAGIWRLTVAAGAQGTGVGRFAVRAVLDEALRRGATEATVLWHPGPGGPEGFFRRLGFLPTGDRFGDRVVGRYRL